MSEDDPRHGSNAGYRAHIGDGETPCRRCRDAASRYERGRQWDGMCGRPRVVDATGTMLRLRALAVMGWSYEDVAQEAGIGASQAWRVRAGIRERILRTTADAVAEVYERLSMTHGLSAQTRGKARGRGWLPPLAYDDIDEVHLPKDDHLDQEQHLTRSDAMFGVHPGSVSSASVGKPCHADDVDEVVVLRILAGDYRLRASVAEKAEVVRRWRGSLNDLEELTGWRVHRYKGRAAA